MPRTLNETLLERIHRELKQDGDHLVWTGSTSNGYGSVTYKKKTYRVHRQYWIETRGSIPEGLVVMHECDIRTCVTHLKLGTNKDNTEDMIKKGRHARKGQQPGQSWCNLKLTEDQVRDILSSQESHYAMAKKYGVSRTTIAAIRQRKYWRHVEV